jgi:hypothetical protein
MTWQEYWDYLEPPTQSPMEIELQEHREVCNGCSQCEPEFYYDEEDLYE